MNEPKPRASLSTLDFRRRYEEQWIELERLVDRALHRGLRRHTTIELQRMISLYRRAIGSLAIAREIVLDEALVDYLEALCARAYLALHGASRPQRSPLLSLLLARIPRAVRAIGGELLVAGALLLLGVAIGWLLCAADPAWFFALVDDELAGSRSPAARTEDLADMLYNKSGSHTMLRDFAGFLFVHNASVAILAFTLGFMAGLPTIYLLVSNGLTLGAFCALYFERGLGTAFLGWLLPHGVPELAAVVLCGAGGLAIGRALLFPGRKRVLQALQDAGRGTSPVVIAALLLLALAAGIEGVFRQLVVDDLLRYALVALNLAWICAWLGLAGRRRTPLPESEPKPEPEPERSQDAPA